MKFRLYFNHARAPEGVWSLDFGTTESEENFDSIVCRVPITSRFNLDAQWPEPKAWFEGVGEVMRVGRSLLIK